MCWLVLPFFAVDCVGIVGEIEETGEDKNYFIWTHKKFDIGYSDNQVCVVFVCVCVTCAFCCIISDC